MISSIVTSHLHLFICTFVIRQLEEKTLTSLLVKTTQIIIFKANQLREFLYDDGTQEVFLTYF